MLSLAQQLEQVAGLGIFVVATALAALSLVAWRRERERRMFFVSVAYGLFVVNGFALFVEPFLLVYRVLPAGTIELIEHSTAFLVLIGLLAFFAAIARE